MILLVGLLGNRSAEIALLFIYHYGEIHASAIAADAGLHKTAVLNQLDRFERAGVLVSKQFGRSRVYSFNPKSPFTRPLKELVKIAYESILPEERAELFKTRHRPRRKGKPVISATGRSVQDAIHESS